MMMILKNVKLLVYCLRKCVCGFFLSATISVNGKQMCAARNEANFENEKFLNFPLLETKFSAKQILSLLCTICTVYIYAVRS